MPDFDHRNLTGAVAVHPAAYVQATDPGAVGAKKSWYDTSTGPPYQHYVRNDANSGWNAIGSAGSLSDPTTTTGDLIVRGASVLGRLAIGASGTILTSNGTTAVYSGSPTLSGLLSAAGLKSTGVTGAPNQARLMGSTSDSSPPTTGTFATGDLAIDVNGRLYVCAAGGTPGTWIGVVPNNTTARGDLLYRDVAGGMSQLAVGAAGTVLIGGTDPSYSSTPTLSGLFTAAGVRSSGVTGATSSAGIMGRTALGAPVTGTFSVGDIVPDNTGALYICTIAGTPGTWTAVSGTGGGSSGATGSGALVPIQAFGPLGSSQATFAFTVPAGYRNLRMILIGRSAGAVTRTQCVLQFNGDSTAANYISQLENSTSTTITSQAFTTTAGAVIGQVPGTSATNTARPAAFTVDIPNYVGTTWQKALYSVGVHHDGSTTTMNQTTAAHWLNTAAITSITASLVSGNFETGSYVCLYGERDSLAPSAGALEVASVFQSQKIDGTTSITTTNTSFAVIDNTDLPAKNMYLLAGDVVKLTIQGQTYNTGSNVTGFDFQVVQPAAGTVRAAPNADYGAGLTQGTVRTSFSIATTFTAVETGTHTFQPMWRVNAGTATLSNATSGTDDTIALFMVEKLGALQIPYLHFQNQQTSGTAGGTFTSGAWQTRVLNTELDDTHGLAALSSNQIPLPAGTYRARASGQANMVGFHQLRIQDVTNATTLVLGTNSYSHVAANGNDVATVHGRFTLSAAASVELQHRCGTTRSTDGFGAQASWGTEVYADIELWKEA